MSTLIIWGLAAYYSALIVQVGCSKMAELSVSFSPKKVKIDPIYSFESLKYRCVAEVTPQGKAFLAFYAILPSSQSPF